MRKKHFTKYKNRSLITSPRGSRGDMPNPTEPPSSNTARPPYAQRICQKTQNHYTHSGHAIAMAPSQKRHPPPRSHDKMQSKYKAHD